MMKTNQPAKRQIAVNTQLCVVLILFLLFVAAAIVCVLEQAVGPAIGFGIATLLPVFVFLISPLYFIFDDQAVKIVYHFGQSEIIAWNSIRSISLSGSWMLGGGLPHYTIAFPRGEKRAFFVNGEIPKTGRTKKLIGLYYKKKIV